MAFKQALDTSALVWRNGQVDTVQLDGHEALLRALVTFMADKPTLSVSYIGTGNGQINFLDGGVGGLTETWTITLTSPTAFTVSGSLSGAQAGGTVGVNYTTTGSTLTSLLSFVIIAGGTPFVNTDAFTVTATANTIPAADVWVLDAWNNFDLFSTGIGDALWWHGEGDGTQAIYAGIHLQNNAPSQIWNWVHRCATGFSGTAVWTAQPGTSPDTFTAFWNNDMLYWVIGNGRRYCVAARVSTTYHSIYQGLFLPFGSPTEFPLPICNIGEKDDEEAWNSTAIDFNNPVIADFNGFTRDVSGTWLIHRDSTAIGNIQLWPSNNIGTSVEAVWDNHENFNNGDHQLFPVVIIEGPIGGISTNPLGVDPFGVLDGVRIVTGFGNSAETILTIATVDHVVFQNIFRTNRKDFWVMEMA